MERQFTFDTPELTENFAEKLGEIVTSGQIIILIGDLGAGKTTFTKGFGKGLTIKRMIKSPSYTIIREYEEGRLPFYHMDLYRLEGNNDDLGLEEYFEGEGVVVIEWGNLLEEFPKDYLQITFEKDGETKRTLHLKAFGEKSADYLRKIGEYND